MISRNGRFTTHFATQSTGTVPARILAALAERTEALTHSLLPRCCALCTLPLEHPDERRAGWCAPCADSLPGGDARRCPICAIPVATSAAPTMRPGSCPTCTRDPPPFARTIALADYAPPLDRLILAMKFGRVVALARPLGAALAERIDCPLDLLVPVPLSPARLAERGFNQAWLICREIARRRAMRAATPLLRTRHDPPQSLQPLAQRAPNLRGAFACARDLSGLRVGIVDDVMTSGATLAEAARTLKSAGAAFVANIVAARTPPP